MRRTRLHRRRTAVTCIARMPLLAASTGSTSQAPWSPRPGVAVPRPQTSARRGRWLHRGRRPLPLAVGTRNAQPLSSCLRTCDRTWGRAGERGATPGRTGGQARASYEVVERDVLSRPADGGHRPRSASPSAALCSGAGASPSPARMTGRPLSLWSRCPGPSPRRPWAGWRRRGEPGRHRALLRLPRPVTGEFGVALAVPDADAHVGRRGAHERGPPRGRLRRAGLARRRPRHRFRLRGGRRRPRCRVLR